MRINFEYPPARRNKVSAVMNVYSAKDFELFTL